MHLPLMEFGDEGQSLARLTRAVDAARACGFAAVSANDHFLFQTPWLDGPTALAAVIERSGAMELATTVALVALRGPVPLAKTLAALDLLSDGRVVAGVGPGSSERDYDAVGVPYEERWERFDEAIAILRSLLRGDPPPGTRATTPAGRAAGAGATPARRHPALDRQLGLEGRPSARRAPRRRVARVRLQHDARAASGPRGGRWPSSFARHGRDPDRFPNTLATMWTWITEDARDADRVLREVLAPMLRRDPDALRDQLCIGPAERCAELLSRYAEARL